MLGHDTSYKILNGANPKGDRSHSLATALNEWFGWANWAAVNGVAVQGTPEELAHHAGAALGIDSERVERIVKSINQTNVQPAALYWGNEESCWKKVESILLSRRTNANLMWHRRTNSDCHKKARSPSQRFTLRMNHTPAPWKAIGLEQGLSLKTAIEETPRKSHTSIKSVLVISTKAKYSIATIRFHPEMSREEITQNAQLIASAPELLKLVTAAVQTLGTSHPIAQKIQAVVSKITGINEPQ
jgi:hypothetical protein